MSQTKLLITMKDIQRFNVLKDIINKKLTGSQAAELLGLTYVHISRLKKKLLTGGFEALLRKSPPSPPNKKITESKRSKIIKLRKEIYPDFNINHFNDKLNQLHHIHFSYTSIRKILIDAGLHSPKKKKIVHRQRRRMPKAGMLVQMDSSQHRWFEHIREKWWLTAMIDDAINEVPYVRFFPEDSLSGNMHVIRRFIELKGLFMSLYVDKASHFKTTRHGGLHYTVNPEQDETQIERALNELAITLIPANSPQAKGRIEVLFRLFQDRLIKEMRLAKVKNYTQTNKFLIQIFLPWYNAKYSHKNVESTYLPLPPDKNLDTIFCIKKQRTVNSDNTLQVQGKIVQIPPSNIHLSFARRKVDVCILEDNRILILYKGSIICQSKLSKNNKIYKKEKKIKNLLNFREYFSQPRKKYIPPPDHPWRKFKFGRKSKIFDTSKFNISKN